MAGSPAGIVGQPYRTSPAGSAFVAPVVDQSPALNQTAALRAKASYLAYRGLGAGIARAPEIVSRTVAAAIVEVMARRTKGPALQMEKNLARVLASTSSGVVPDPALVRRWARRSFRSYGRYWLEGAALSTIDPVRIAARMWIESGWEHLEEAMAAGRGVVMALPHVGSWEWGGAFLTLEGYPMTTVAERLEPPELLDWFIAQREALGLRIVPLDGASSGALLRALREGRLVGLLCDRDIAGSGVQVSLFGEQTTLPSGPATLALRTGSALVAAVVYSGPGRDHTAVISPPLDTTRTGSLRRDVVRLTEAIARHHERFIQRAPEQWHLFQPNWPSDRDGDRVRGLDGR